MKTLSGKAAIVTGSTSGIGEGIAKCFAEAGADVMLNGFGDAAEIEKLRAGMEKQYGVRVRYHNSDMSKPADVVDLVKTTEKEFGKVDILVNNAGIQFVAPIEEFPVEKWDAIIAINLSSAFHSIRTAIPGMKQRKWGRIINVASAHGLVASAEKSAYVTSKHGIVGLTKVVALENAGKGITCNAICPGWVLTPLVQKQIDAKAAEGKISVEQAKINLLSEKQPSKEFVHVEELGALAVFLCSDAAHNMTGTTLSMDGGWTAQ